MFAVAFATGRGGSYGDTQNRSATPATAQANARPATPAAPGSIGTTRPTDGITAPNATKQNVRRQPISFQRMNKKQKNNSSASVCSARFIRVEKCGVDSCPFCWPHATREDVNFCYHPWRKGAKIGIVKTFPRFCPLQNAKQIN